METLTALWCLFKCLYDVFVSDVLIRKISETKIEELGQASGP